MKPIAINDHGIDQIKATAKDGFAQAMAELPNLKDRNDWWVHVPWGEQLTGVGRALGRANAHRLDTNGMLPAQHS